MKTVEQVMLLAPVIPVLVIEDVAHAIPIAQALVAGGLTALEVTLRTPCALDVIRAMKQVPGAVVGAGTVLNPRDLDAALKAGAEFIVSPGLTQGRVCGNIPALEQCQVFYNGAVSPMKPTEFHRRRR